MPRSEISITSYAIPFKIPGSQRDRQILHYFCVQGAHEIASHFNVDFWTKTVLEQSHQDSVVRQALVSLSSLHLDCTTAATARPDHTKHGPLAQYGKAIHSLRRRIERPDPNTIKAALTCCILFCCFEEALGDSEAAIRHLNSGLDLLSAQRNSLEFEHDSQLDAMSRVFESLDLQATVFDLGRTPRLHLSTEADGDEKAFLSLDEAYGAFRRLQTSLFHFFTTHLPHKFCGEDSLPPLVSEQKSLFQDRFRAWLARFEQSAFGENTDKSEHLGAQLLIIQYHVSKMVLDANYPINESIFGASPNPRVEKILDMAHELFRHSQGAKASLNQGNVSQRRTFSSENGIVTPLFALAAKCSDETVCDRALELLTRSQRREGLYDSGIMAGVIHHFRAARQSQIHENLKLRAESLTALSLEALLEQEVDGKVGSIQSLANRLDSNHWHALAGRGGGRQSLLIAFRTILL